MSKLAKIEILDKRLVKVYLTDKGTSMDVCRHQVKDYLKHLKTLGYGISPVHESQPNLFVDQSTGNSRKGPTTVANSDEDWWKVHNG